MRPPCVLKSEHWPPDYVAVYQWRQQQLLKLRSSRTLLAGALEYYSSNPVDFICHWFDTYDPRNALNADLPARLPLVLFERQAKLVEFVVKLVSAQESGMVEKSRDMGATWVCGAVSVWFWRFRPGASVGWGSRKEQLVDKLDDPDSIFEKMRQLVRGLPDLFLPRGFNPKAHMPYMRIVNPENGATITGEAGDNIGRGGRKLVYFKDESAHYERPEKIEAALADTTRVQVDISSVAGTGNVFHRRREAGVVWDGGEIHKGATNVFIMDWRDHPAKDDAWYEQRRRKAEQEGLSHVFAQEVDRDYAAAVEGIIIPAAWVNSAIDAHKRLNWEPGGPRLGGLDVADEGGDRNALARREGPVLCYLDQWGEGDVGKTARRAITACGTKQMELMYDSVGIGAGVKSEANRLRELGKLPPRLRLVPWNGGARPRDADKHVEPHDRDSPTHGELYHNLKAQGWWELRKRFERTHRAVTEGLSFDHNELISLSSELPYLKELQKELSQPTATRSASTLKLVVNKTPPGTRSPNLADAVVMCFWPVGLKRYTLENV